MNRKRILTKFKTIIKCKECHFRYKKITIQIKNPMKIYQKKIHHYSKKRMILKNVWKMNKIKQE